MRDCSTIKILVKSLDLFGQQKLALRTKEIEGDVQKIMFEGPFIMRFLSKKNTLGSNPCCISDAYQGPLLLFD